MEKCIGFNLTSLSNEKLTIDKIERFNAITFELFNKYKIVPTYWGIDGKGFSEKLLQFTSKKLKNLKEKKKYVDRDGNLIEGLGYIVNPSSSDEPAFDGYLRIDISYSEPNKCLEITLSIDLNKIIISKEEIGNLFLAYEQLFIVDFGFIYEHEDFEHVNAVTLNYDDGQYTDEERNIADWWYDFETEEKLRNPRALFTVNYFRKKLFSSSIEKILKADRDLFNFYNYKGKGFVEVGTNSKDYICLLEKEYGDYCIS